jgi:hypothetical protein
MYQIRNNTKEGYAAKATSFYIDIVAKDYAELKRKMDDIVHTKFRHLNYNYEEIGVQPVTTEYLFSSELV